MTYPGTPKASQAAITAVQEALYDLIVDDPMWCDSVGRPLHYSSEREARIGEFLDRAAVAAADAAAPHNAADAWDQGYQQGLCDEISEWERADNPYRIERL